MKTGSTLRRFPDRVPCGDAAASALFAPGPDPIRLCWGDADGPADDKDGRSARMESGAISQGGWTAAEAAREGRANEDARASAAGRCDDLRTRLEREGVLLIDAMSFRLTEDELRLTGRRWGDGRSKNVSYNPHTGRVDGAFGAAPVFEELRALMGRYAAWSQDVIASLFPGYLAAAELGRTSFRPRSVLERPRSLRKDDRRLHVDAFTSQPVAGRR